MYAFFLYFWCVVCPIFMHIYLVQRISAFTVGK